MDSSCAKLYHLHECDGRSVLHIYFSPDTDKQMFYEIVIFPMKELQKLKTTGNVMIDFSTAPILFQLLAICEDFNEFIVLEAHESNKKELESWLNKEEEANDWRHLSECFPELGSDWEKWSEREEILRRKMKLKMFNIDKYDPTDPFMSEKADCVLSIYLLQHASKDKDSFCINLKKLSSFMRVGGQLVLIGSFGGKYFTVGDQVFHILTYDEDFLRKAVAGAGFKIEYLQVLKSTVDNNVIKYGDMYSLRALKERDV